MTVEEKRKGNTIEILGEKIGGQHNQHGRHHGERKTKNFCSTSDLALRPTNSYIDQIYNELQF